MSCAAGKPHEDEEARGEDKPRDGDEALGEDKARDGEEEELPKDLEED